MSYQEEAEAEEQPFQVDSCSMILLAAALGAAAEGPTCFCGYFFPLLLLVWWRHYGLYLSLYIDRGRCLLLCYVMWMAGKREDREELLL
jgi:hypothetical protein